MQKSFLVFMLLAFSLFPSTVFTGGYLTFTELPPNKCVTIDPQRAAKLPSSWNKFHDFTKMCRLKQPAGSNAVLSVVSVWTEDYRNAHGTEVWPNFPHSVIVDEQMNIVGDLPVIFPIEAPVEPTIYLGKWKYGIPTEIRVDVYDPTVVGDHYYAPLIWNEKKKRYYMKDKEYKQGTRPKHDR